MNREGGLTVYRNCTPVVDKRYETDSDQTLIQVVIKALAEAEGVAPTDLPPLYDTINPDTLSNFCDQQEGATAADGILGFRFETWHVFVHGDGRIRVCDGTQFTDPTPVFEGATD